MSHQLQAVIFGAIGTIAETSDIQRQAFNAAFAAAGLDWHWNAQIYRDLLKINGGQQRLRAYRDAAVDRTDVTDTQIATLHQSKTDLYAAMLDRHPLRPRPGVVETIEMCRSNNIQVALCTSTAMANIEGLRAALAELLPFDKFVAIVSIESLERTKPAPDAYSHCLNQLGLPADRVIAIEDTPVSIAAAKTAGICTIATPGAMTSDQDFSAADLVVPDLSGMTLDRLAALLRQPASISG